MSTPDEAERSGRAERRLALALAAALLLPALALRSTWAPDEARYADVAGGMLASGDLVLPRLHGEIYGEKPPVFFWAAAALARLGVPLGLAPRAVSVAAGLATLALLPALGAGLGQAPAAAARAALLLATTPLFLAFAQFGNLDALLTLLVALACLAKVRRARARLAGRAGLAALEGLALGGALLTKGPVALLAPVGLRLGALLGPRGGPARADRWDALAALAALALAGAWLAAAAGRASGSFVEAITLGQVLRRASGDVPHPGLPGYLLAATAVGLLPWSLFAGRALAARRREAAPAAGWLALHLGVLALLPSQQVQYALPAFPAAALLLAPGTLAERPSRALAGLVAAAGALLVAAALLWGTLLPAARLDAALRAQLLADPWLRGALGAAGVALLALGLLPARHPALRPGWRRGVLATVAFGAAALAAVGRVDPLMAPRSLLESPAVLGAARMVSPSGLRSWLRVEAGVADVGRLEDARVLEALRRDPQLVAVVRGDKLGLALPAGERSVEEVARGWFFLRPVVALRQRRGA